MAERSRGILFFALIVALLLVISARVSPGEARDPSVALRRTPAPDEIVGADGTAAFSPETARAPDMGIDIRVQFPDVSASDWNLRLVNNEYELPASFTPDVTGVRDGEYFDSRAARALEDMLAGAEAAGHTVCIRAAYRPYQTQAYLFFSRAAQISEDQEISYEIAEQLARSVVAYPGTSEHQSALCVDLMDDLGTVMTAAEVENLPVLAWLRAHCAEYGFIYRYPKEKQALTGWYEPWHFRYVGPEAAAYIMENGLCLEEFIALF